MTDSFTATGVPDQVTQWPDGNVSFNVESLDFRLSNKLQSHGPFKPVVFQASETGTPVTVTYHLGAPKRNGQGNFLNIDNVALASGPTGMVPQYQPMPQYQQAPQQQPQPQPQPQVPQATASPPVPAAAGPSPIHAYAAQQASMQRHPAGSAAGDDRDTNIRVQVALKAAVASMGPVPDQDPQTLARYMDQVAVLTESYAQVLSEVVAKG
jgi:hypothetical protein